jgi:hypothetical protein
MQFEQELRALLRKRNPRVSFKYKIKDRATLPVDGDSGGVRVVSLGQEEIGAGLFFGSARSVIEAELSHAADRVVAGEQDDAMQAFVKEIVGLQSAPGSTHDTIARHMQDKGYLLSIEEDGADGNVLSAKIGAETILMPEEQSDTSLKDLIVVLLLRFGAFPRIDDMAADNERVPIGDGTQAVLGANLVLAFLFKAVHEENARNSLRSSMTVDGGDEYIDKAGDHLNMTRHLEGAERVVAEKAHQVRAATRVVMMESACVLILAVTLLGVVWLRGGRVLASHRTLPWIGSASILVYVLGRMTWLHIPQT